MEDLNLLLNMCKINSVSQKEDTLVNFLKKELKNFSDEIKITNLKSVVAKIKNKKNSSSNSKLKIALEAHIDSVGLVVEEITKDGFLKIANFKNIDPKALISKEVVVCAKKEFLGFVFSPTTNKEKIDSNNIFVNLNLTEKKAKQNIKKGDSIVFKFNPIFLKDDKISVRFLDNKASVAAIFLALKKLKKTDFNVDLYVIFSSLEETNQKGATTAAYFKKPDILISVDVSFAKTLNTPKQNELAKMGEGPLIGISPILNKKFTQKLLKIAKEKKIPHQLEIMPGLTGTNADELLAVKDGILTCLCSIPIKNMHTQVEIVDLKDIKNTAELIYNFVVSFKGD